MSMCYLCDMCANRSITEFDDGSIICFRGGAYKTKKLAIDYGRDDPREICQYFKRKEWSE